MEDDFDLLGLRVTSKQNSLNLKLNRKQVKDKKVTIENKDYHYTVVIAKIAV